MTGCGVRVNPLMFMLQEYYPSFQPSHGALANSNSGWLGPGAGYQLEGGVSTIGCLPVRAAELQLGSPAQSAGTLSRGAQARCTAAM